MPNCWVFLSVSLPIELSRLRCLLVTSFLHDRRRAVCPASVSSSASTVPPQQLVFCVFELPVRDVWLEGLTSLTVGKLSFNIPIIPASPESSLESYGAAMRLRRQLPHSARTRRAARMHASACESKLRAPKELARGKESQMRNACHAMRCEEQV